MTTSSPASSSSSLLQFLPLHSQISPNFWHTFTTLKLNTLRLNEDDLDITASYSVGKYISSKESNNEKVGISSGLILDEYSLPSPNGTTIQESGESNNIPTMKANGKIRNYNTAPQFTSSNKNDILNSLAKEILTEMTTSTDPVKTLNRFMMITFADLKKYRYYHWVCIPAFIFKPNWMIRGNFSGIGQEFGQNGVQLLKNLLKGHLKESSSSAGFALVRVGQDKDKSIQIGNVVDFQEFFKGVANEQRYCLFVDPSTSPGVPGWPLRNLLALLSIRYGVRDIKVICWRDDLAGTTSDHNSIVGRIFLPEQDQSDSSPSLVWNGSSISLAPLSTDTANPASIGWERNPQGKVAPKVSDLGPLMDPKRLAEQAVDLNLKLMRWRIMPDVQLDKISSTKCLLLGAGTLGCNVARVLLGWGVRTITFVDSSRVSFSNPVRQPLFEFDDCLNGGKPKAACAADRLSKIFPGAKTSGHEIMIPMPGHPTNDLQSVGKLEKLIEEHDVVFLLMDSRESRWLPTVIGSAKGKIVMNAALGFDSYLVMRHGHQTDEEGKKVGCYFCNDIVAPTDSLTDRTLDQMCTVSRPGLASIAGAQVVELAISLLHPRTSSQSCCLGTIPHQIRGNLSSFNSMNITGMQYDKCTACSDIVIKEYTESRDVFLKGALSQGSEYLEKLTGLDVLYKQTEEMLLAEQDAEEGNGDDWE
ncbi:unnamed protein product [Sympodiomycopsis kandeliae]